MASARRKVNTTQDEDDSYWNQSSTFKRFNFNDDIVESDSIDIITWGGDSVVSSKKTQQNVVPTPPRPISSSSTLPTSARQHPSRRKIADHLPQPTSSLSSSFNKGTTNLQRPEVKVVGGATEMAKLKTEIEILKDQVDKARKDRSSAPSCDQTLRQMMIGEPYILELYKSKEDKCEILDKAIERFDGNAIVATTLFMRNTLNRELFSKQLMSRPVAVDHYCAYLRASDETDELYETLSSLIKSEEAAILKYKKTLSSTSNSPQIRSSSLKECIKYNFDTDRQLNLEKNMIHEQILLINNQLVIDQKDREMEQAGASSIFKTIPWKNDLINQSVISTLFYCCCYHWDDNSDPASPQRMMERHKISKKQFQFIAVAAHCLTRRYRELEKMLTIEKSLFRSAHLSSVIGIDKVVDILSKYNSPPDVLAKYCYAIENVERKLELAKKHKCYKIAVDAMIAMKNRSDLLAYLYTIPDSHQFLRKQVDEMLKSSSIRWKN